MKLIKIVFCMLLVLSLIFSLVGCFSGGKVNVDKDGNITIKDKDNEGNEVVIGEKKWDKSKMHGLSAPKAKLESYITTEGGTMYEFSEMKENDAKKYLEAIKSAGFTYNPIILGEYKYNGTNKDGLIIDFVYEKEIGAGYVIATKGEVPSDEENKNGAVIGNGDKKWDSSLMGGLPDPGVNVIAYWATGGATNYSLEVIPSFMRYVQKIKACGFTQDISETEIDSLYIYVASNSAGDRVTFSVGTDTSTIVFEKQD